MPKSTRRCTGFSPSRTSGRPGSSTSPTSNNRWAVRISFSMSIGTIFSPAMVKLQVSSSKLQVTNNLKKRGFILPV